MNVIWQNAMASPGQLVEVMADVLGVPVTTARVHDRHLAVAGLRSMHGRGIGAAKVTAGDAARLLVAILGSLTLADSVETVKRYARSRPETDGRSRHPWAHLRIDELTTLAPEHSLTDALEALIISAATGTLAAMMDEDRRGTRATRVMVAPMMEISMLATATLGAVRIAGVGNGRTAALRYSIPFTVARKRPSGRALEAWATADRGSRGDLRRFGGVSEVTVVRLGELLAPPEEEGG